MPELPHPVPPEAYANPYAAGALTSQVICHGIRSLFGLIGRRREVRMLERIGVLPADWDVTGRHCLHP